MLDILETNNENKGLNYNEKLVAIHSATGVGRSRYLHDYVYKERQKGLNCLLIVKEHTPTHAHAMQLSRHTFEIDPENALSDSDILKNNYNIEQGVLLTEAHNSDASSLGGFTTVQLPLITFDTIEDLVREHAVSGVLYDVVAIDGLDVLAANLTQESVYALTYQVSKAVEGHVFKPVITLQVSAFIEKDLQRGKHLTNIPHTMIRLESVTRNKLIEKTLSFTERDVNVIQKPLEVLYEYCVFK